MKVKQKIAFNLLAIYVLSVIGLAMSLHFCGGKLSAVSFSKEKAACGICKNEPLNKKDDGCCHDKQIDVKVKDSHQSAGELKLPQIFGLDLFLHPVFADFLYRTIPVFFSYSENKAPPLSARISLHAFNCVFRN